LFYLFISFIDEELQMKQKHTSTVLAAAIVSASFVLGLFAIFPLRDMARDFTSTSSTEDTTLPEQESTDSSCNPIDDIIPVCIKNNKII
jgi:hypothetical protein